MITTVALKQIKGLRKREFCGPRGSGKTTRLEQFVRENNLRVVDIEYKDGVEILYYTITGAAL